jgi:hypothetical protein
MGKHLAKTSAEIYRFLLILHFPLFRFKGRNPFYLGGGRALRQQPHLSIRDPFGIAALIMG